MSHPGNFEMGTLLGYKVLSIQVSMPIGDRKAKHLAACPCPSAIAQPLNPVVRKAYLRIQRRSSHPFTSPFDDRFIRTSADRGVAASVYMASLSPTEYCSKRRG
jgi:hypothetical protein